jgi:hypothetical protein
MDVSTGSHQPIRALQCQHQHKQQEEKGANDLDRFLNQADQDENQQQTDLRSEKLGGWYSAHCLPDGIGQVGDQEHDCPGGEA